MYLLFLVIGILMANFVKEYLSDFVSLFYPSVCASCGNDLMKGEEVICLNCLYHLPQTHFDTERENPMEKHFWGRINLTKATALYLFQKGSKVQHLVHQLKYKGRTEVGVKLGKILGRKLLDSHEFNDIDIIVPVPLHPAREYARGYNQSDFFAIGLSEEMQIAWSRKILYRIAFRQSQTKKSRFERWNNVENTFQLTDEAELTNKHILLVDDVMTTGSTIESCTKALQQSENVRVSVATIATAIH